ncbi:hypothetical protein AB8975_21425 [Yersinia enterocolitica]|uniref:hypothetical protein n=1 Tax=Yersinia enterocolitica TaxID=630 RepID=UPI003CFD5F3B
MADENTGLVVIDIKPESYPTLYVTSGLDKYLDQIRQEVSEVPDLSTTKGRERIKSLAASVSRSKTAIEKPGRDYLKKLKEAVKPAEAEIKRFVDACDALRDETRRPLTEWEAEQERLKLEAERIAAEEAYSAMWQEAHDMDAIITIRIAEKSAAKKESDHEMALLMNDAFDRAQADKAAEAERKRIAYEEELKRLAENAARLAVEEEARREREEAAHRESVLKAQAEQAERDRIALTQKAEQDRIDAANKAEADRLAAAQKAEREKQEAIAAEKLKAQQEAERVQREAKQKEDARLAEEKRVADEAVKKAADKAHQAEVNNAAIAVLTKAGIDAECAKACVIAIVKNQVTQSFLNQQPPIQMNY